MSLRSLNLNLLPVLQALLRERSVSDAAASLAMSQSAASEALAKIRATFDDAMLVRVGQHMELTPRAQAMVAPLDELCRELELFHSAPAFDAPAAVRTFTIAGNDYAIERAGPAVLTALRTRAPDIALRVMPQDAQLIPRLVAGEIDFALLPKFVVADLPQDMLRYRKIFEDHAVAVFDRGHPLAGRATVGKSDLDRYRAVIYHPGSLRIGRRHANAFSGGKPFRVRAYVPEVGLIPPLICNSDDFGILPLDFHRSAPDRGIVECELQFAMPTLEVGLVWGPAQERDSGHRWLRELIVESAARIGPIEMSGSVKGGNPASNL